MSDWVAGGLGYSLTSDNEEPSSLRSEVPQAELEKRSQYSATAIYEFTSKEAIWGASLHKEVPLRHYSFEPDFYEYRRTKTGKMPALLNDLAVFMVRCGAFRMEAAINQAPSSPCRSTSVYQDSGLVKKSLRSSSAFRWLRSSAIIWTMNCFSKASTAFPCWSK